MVFNTRFLVCLHIFAILCLITAFYLSYMFFNMLLMFSHRFPRCPYVVLYLSRCFQYISCSCYMVSIFLCVFLYYVMFLYLFHACSYMFTILFLQFPISFLYGFYMFVYVFTVFFIFSLYARVFFHISVYLSDMFYIRPINVLSYTVYYLLMYISYSFLYVFILYLQFLLSFLVCFCISLIYLRNFI